MTGQLITPQQNTIASDVCWSVHRVSDQLVPRRRFMRKIFHHFCAQRSSELKSAVERPLKYGEHLSPCDIERVFNVQVLALVWPGWLIRLYLITANRIWFLVIKEVHFFPLFFAETAQVHHRGNEWVLEFQWRGSKLTTTLTKELNKYV